MKRCTPLEEPALEVSMKNSQLPLIFQLPPECGRDILDAAQNTLVYQYPVSYTHLNCDSADR